MSSFAGARIRPLAILLLLLLLAHAPLLLNDGLVMDDWLNLQLRSDSPIDLGYLLHGAGHPVFYGYLMLANLTGASVLAMKMLALVSILVGAGCLFLAATRAGLLTPTEAVGCALIVWIYPGYQMWAGKANSIYVFSFALFFVGVWLLSLAFSIKSTHRVPLRIATVAVFFFSFALNSTMVLYAFAMFGLFIAVWCGNERVQGPVRRLFSSAWRCVIRYPEFVVLPLIYWGALNLWFKRVGVYAQHYDAHLPTFPELLQGWSTFFEVGYRDVFRDAILAARDHHFVLAFVALPIVCTLVLLRLGARQSRASVASIVLPLLFSVSLFLALALPYLVAGLTPGSNFYETRHLLMFGAPLALGLLGLKRLLGYVMGDRAAFASVFGLALVVSEIMLWNDYMFMQARALKQAALSIHLAAMPRPNAIVFDLEDGFLDYPSRHLAFGVPEIDGTLRFVWGDHPFLGFTRRAERSTILQEMELSRVSEGSAYHAIDPAGPQATISLQPGPAAMPNAALSRHYYACRLLARCDVSAFLMQLATVTIEPGPIAGVTPLERSK